MFRTISKNSGFHKLEKDGVKYNVSAKKFAELESQGQIEVVKKITPSAPKQDEITDIVKPDPKKDLMKLKKADLAELATRYGFEGEVTEEITKTVLVDFIIENSDSE